MRIRIEQIGRGGWSFEARFEAELFSAPIAAVGRGRNLREAVGDLIFQSQRESKISVSVGGKRERAARLRRAEKLPAADREPELTF